MPSPGQCLAAGAMPDSMIPRMYSVVNAMVWSGSDDHVRTETIGLRQLR